MALVDLLASIVGINDSDTLRNIDFQKEFQWDIKFPELGQLSVLGVSIVDIGRFVQSVSFGDYSMEKTEQVRVGAFVNNFAGSLNLPPLKITFVRPIPDVVVPYLIRWRKLIVDDTGIYSPKVNYAKNIYIYLLGMDNLISGTFKLVNCFPKTLPTYDLSYEGQGVVKIEAEFSYDRIDTV